MYICTKHQAHPIFGLPRATLKDYGTSIFFFPSAVQTGSNDLGSSVLLLSLTTAQASRNRPSVWDTYRRYLRLHSLLCKHYNQSVNQTQCDFYCSIVNFPHTKRFDYRLLNTLVSHYTSRRAVWRPSIIAFRTTFTVFHSWMYISFTIPPAA